MPGSFLVTLDRQTQIGVAINGGSGTTTNTTVTLDLDLDADAVLVKIWGDINPLDPANANYGETEATAPWIEADESFLVHLTTNPGAKNLSARVRDDVDNEAVGTDSIVLEVEGVEPEPGRPPRQRPKPLPGPPEPPRPEPEIAEVIGSSSGVALATSATAGVQTVSRDRGVTLQVLPDLVQGRVATVRSELQLATSVQNYVTTAVKPGRGGGFGLGAAPGSVGKRDDPELLAVLLGAGEL